MTLVFQKMLDSLGLTNHLIDRRFSRNVAEVGCFSPRKACEAVSIFCRLVRAIFSGRYDTCVFFVTNRTLSFVVDVVLAEVLRWSKISVVMYVHTLGYDQLAKKNMVSAWAVKRLIGSASHVVVLGPSLITDVKKYVRGEIHVIPNTPLDVPANAGELKVSDHVRVLFFSNMIADKGIEDFVTCALSLAPLNDNVTFSIVGGENFIGQIEGIIALVSAHGLHDRINVIGHVGHDRKWKVLDDTDLLVFPSIYEFEAQPLTIIEAGSRSVATIAYSTGGISDIVIDDVSGVLVDAGDVVALEASIQRLISDREELERLCLGAKTHFDEQLSFTRYQQQWRVIFDDNHNSTVRL